MKALKIVGGVLGAVVVIAAAFYGWVSWKTSSILSQTVEVHEVEVPVPFPLAKWEIDLLREERAKAQAPAQPAEPTEAPVGGEGEEGDRADDAAAEGDAEEAPAEPVAAADPLEGVDLDAIALERAKKRGKHLVEARYACLACHGENFGGGTMVDDPMIGTLLGPNITSGKGGRTAKYTSRDWDRIVRHGVLPDGRPAAMPSEDFKRMSDQELSDIIAYVTSMPPVDAEVARPALGPLGKFLVATGKLPLSALVIEDHQAAHPVRPPKSEPTAEFGEHLASVCVGCHRTTFQGGPIAGAPPDWIPAANITLHDSGVGAWDFAAFEKAMRQGVRPDGSEIRMPMTEMLPFTKRMTDVELRALWAYMESLPKMPTGT